MAIEIGKKYLKIKWDDRSINGIDTTFKWNTAPNNPSYPRYTWDEVELIQHAAGEDYNLWEEDKKKRLVKLILKVQGNTITESKKREIKQYKIKAKDIKIVAEKVLGIEVITENIKF
jgi:hypothetical protein|tara:strand:- start:329 stop:679 length:351 start_codon:yes stop_codon:yes gene_type:complete